MNLSPCLHADLPPHDLPFDPTYGYALDALLKIEAPVGPPDFAAFWQQTYEAARAVPLRLVTRRSTLSTPEREVWEAEWDSLDGVRIGGWIVLPHRSTPDTGFVVSHGYGGREAPDITGNVNSAYIFPCARGFHRSASTVIPDVSARHVLHGIEARETYVHRGCAADIWSAASVLLEIVPSVKERLFFRGGSFGGGIGALAVPWENRFARAFLDVPSFGHHPLRVTIPCSGSGEAVRHYYGEHPEVLNVLQYFDSATAARHIRMPTFVAAALFDPSVPPPGQFAVYNGLSCEKELFVRRAGHFAHPGEAEEAQALEKELAAWFRPVQAAPEYSGRRKGGCYDERSE